MRRGDRDDPFDDFIREFERMMEEMLGGHGAAFNIETMRGPTTDQETHVDIHEEDDELLVIMDLPGVEKDDINVSCDGQTVFVSASGPRREYDEQIRLPKRVDEQTASAQYNNGVLEVTFSISGSGKSIDVN